MKKIILTLVFAILSIALFSQTYEVPKDYKLEKAEDYVKYEQDVIKCYTFIMNTPINDDNYSRKEFYPFLIEWIGKNPKIHVSINKKVATFIGTSPDLLMVFKTGWAIESINTGKYDNKLEGNLAGIESVIKFYTANKEALGKNKHVEKYIKLKKKGKLKKFVEDNI